MGWLNDWTALILGCVCWPTLVCSCRGDCCVLCCLHSWQFTKCSCPVSFILAYFSSWPESFWSAYVSRLFWCTSCTSVCSPHAFVYLSTGPDHEAQFDPECWAHSQSNQRVCEETGLRLYSQTGAHKCYAGQSFTVRWREITGLTGHEATMCFWSLLCLPCSGFYEGRVSWFTEDSSSPSCDDHLRQLNVSFSWKEQLGAPGFIDRQNDHNSQLQVYVSDTVYYLFNVHPSSSLNKDFQTDRWKTVQISSQTHISCKCSGP